MQSLWHLDGNDRVGGELRRRGRPDLALDGPKRVVPSRVDDQVRRQRRPVDDRRELFRARKLRTVRTDGLLALRVELIHADDVHTGAAALAGPLEVRELDQADGQDDDADSGKDQERTEERPQLVDGD